MIAYLLSAYKDPEHLLRLVNALDDGADFYVHVDRNVEALPFERLLRDRVNFVPRHAVSWGGWAQVEYQKELMGAAIASGRDYERLVLLSAQDYPAWPTAKLRRFFAAHPQREFIMGENITRSGRKELLRRVRDYHFFRDAPFESLWWKYKWIVAARHLMHALPIRKRATVRVDGREADVYAGSDYWALTLPCARYVYDVLMREPEVTRYFKHSFVPSEMCVQTIVFASPFAGNVVPYDGRRGLYALTPLHYIDYGKGIKELTLDDLPAIRESGKPFCRKVVTGSGDELMNRLDAEAGRPPAGNDAAARSFGKRTISVVMCTYNGAAYLREQLDSILAQTLQPDEIIVQDDCSTDGTAEILAAYAERHPQLRFFVNERQMGVNRNFFSAMARAAGDFIAISDQDDVWLPEKLERQAATIGNALLAAGLSHPFTTTGAALHVDLRRPNVSLLRLLYVGAFSGHTMFFSRRLLSLLPDTLGEIEALRFYDVILAMTAAAYDGIAFDNRVLVKHRRHVDAASYNRPTDARLTPLNIVRNAARTFKLYRALRGEMCERLAAHLRFLRGIHSDSEALKRAETLLTLQTRRGAAAFVRLQLFCMVHCDELFYTPLRKTPFNRLRGAYFPISCSDYFRYLLKNKA